MSLEGHSQERQSQCNKTSWPIKTEFDTGSGGDLEGDNTEHVLGFAIKSHYEVDEMRGYLVSKLCLPFHVPRQDQLKVRKLG